MAGVQASVARPFTRSMGAGDRLAAMKPVRRPSKGLLPNMVDGGHEVRPLTPPQAPLGTLGSAEKTGKNEGKK